MSIETPSEHLDRSEKMKLVKQSLEQSFSTLTERQAKVLKMRMGLKPYEKRHTLKEIGDAHNITDEPIWVQQNEALHKISLALKQDLSKAEYPTVDIDFLRGDDGLDNLLALIEEVNPEI